MKINVNSKNLLNLLQQCNKVVNNKATLPIIHNLKFDLVGTKLTITGTDLENTLVSSIDVEFAEGNATFLIDSKYIIDALTVLPEQGLELILKDDTLIINALQGEYKLAINANADEFPTIKEMTDLNQLTIDSALLAQAIDNTVYAVANDELRPVMNGIYVDITPEGTCFVATDAHKLVKYNMKDVKATEGNFILPGKPANVVKNMLKEKQDIIIKYNDKNITFDIGRTTLICRATEGRYPNYNAVIPTANDKTVIIDRESLIGAVKRIKVFSNVASSLIRIQFDNNKTTLSAQDIDFSVSAEETHECQYAGESIALGFKATFFQDLLSHIKDDKVIITVSNPGRAALIYPFEQKDNVEVTMLLMPMLLND